MSKIHRKKGCKSANREECQQEQSANQLQQINDPKYEEIAKEVLYSNVVAFSKCNFITERRAAFFERASDAKA